MRKINLLIILYLILSCNIKNGINNHKMKNTFKIITALFIVALLYSCGNGSSSKQSSALSSSAAEKVYVAPGEHDDFYAFVSGGFSGQLAVYGLPSGRLFKVIPVFSVDAEKAWGFNEETKPMLNTSHGFIPWDDSHHPDISQTNGETDGRWIFINGNPDSTLFSNHHRGRS